MKRGVKAALSGVVIVCLTAGMLWYLTGLVERKNSYEKYAEFYEQEDFDVLFFGSSHMVNGVYPMELWKDYGIVSYNFGNHAAFMPLTYWVMRNALQYTTPKLVVVDCLFLESKVKVHPDFSLNHLSMDAFPLSAEKIRAAFDLLDDPVYEQTARAAGLVDRTRSRLGLLWDFVVYHDRWAELGKDDFAPEPTVEKGAETRVNVASPPPAALTEKLGMPENVSTEYLRRIIQDCRNRGIDVLLTYLPFPASENEYAWANTARAIAAECGVGFIDFLQTDTVDFATDCYDEDSHLNASGARKVTDYLGRYITENYDIPDRRDDPAYAGWNEDYAAYTAHKLELLAGQTELKNYLALLQDKNLSACVYLAESGLWQERYRALLENMGVDCGTLPDTGPILLAVDRLGGGTTCLAAGEQADTGFGAVALVQAEGAYSVQIDGQEVLTVQAGDSAGAVSVDNASGRSAAPARFVPAAAGDVRPTE